MFTPGLSKLETSLAKLKISNLTRVYTIKRNSYKQIAFRVSAGLEYNDEAIKSYVHQLIKNIILIRHPFLQKQWPLIFRASALQLYFPILSCL